MSFPSSGKRMLKILARDNRFVFDEERADEWQAPRSGLAVRALVMELVDGETLAERIARGPVPLDEALLLAREIAGADVEQTASPRKNEPRHLARMSVDGDFVGANSIV